MGEMGGAGVVLKIYRAVVIVAFYLQQPGYHSRNQAI